MILVDTSVWIDFLRGADTSQRRMLHSLIEGEEDICLAGIILTEILQGIRNDKGSSEVKRYLLEFPICNPEGTATYIVAADIYRKCAGQGRSVGKTVDCLIAAVAMENDFMLLHNDRDFESIAACNDLKIFKTIL